MNYRYKKYTKHISLHMKIKIVEILKNGLSCMGYLVWRVVSLWRKQSNSISMHNV